MEAQRAFEFEELIFAPLDNVYSTPNWMYVTDNTCLVIKDDYTVEPRSVVYYRGIRNQLFEIYKSGSELVGFIELSIVKGRQIIFVHRNRSDA